MRREFPYIKGKDYKRVNLTQAKKAFYRGESVLLCPIESDPERSQSYTWLVEYSSPNQMNFDELAQYWQRHLGGNAGYRLKYFIENKD